MAKVTMKDASTGQCMEMECKASATRLRFCKDHFGHYKAGAITKNGLRPKDYEKKLAHFEANKANYLK